MPNDKEINLTMSELDANTAGRLRLIYGLRDISVALSAADFLWNLDPDGPCSRIERQRYRCYEAAMVVAYGRLFVKSRPLPRIRLNRIGVEATKEQLELHDRLMEMRHAEIAHVDLSRVRVRIVPHKIELDGRAFHIPEIIFDEGVTFIGAKALPVVEWLRLLRGSLNETIFKEMQETPEAFRLFADHLAAASSHSKKRN